MITIAWDVDDVLNDLMRLWFEKEWLRTHPECQLRYADINENPPHNILGVSREEYLESLDNFRANSSCYKKMVPVLALKEWFIHHGHKFRHIALSAVPYAAAGESAKWVLTHFGEWIRTYHFIPSYRVTCKIPVYDKSKGEYLKWLQRADYLVDDNDVNIKGAESVGLKGVLFPRPWNSRSSKSVNTVLTFLSSLK